MEVFLLISLEKSTALPPYPQDPLMQSHPHNRLSTIAVASKRRKISELDPKSTGSSKR